MPLMTKTGDGQQVPEIPEINRPDRLYHYTSTATLLKMLRSRELWLCDSRSMNDYQENRWILRHIIDYRDRESTNRKLLEPVLQNFDLNDPVPFICCFSEYGDLLSQWRAYAQDATGVAIGLDLRKLNIQYRLPMTSAVAEHTFGIHPVIYDQEYQKQTVETLLSSAVTQLGNEDADAANTHIAAAMHLRQLGFVFKNSSFSEEHEWRIIYTPLITGDDDSVKVVGGQPDLSFRESHGLIAPYFPLSLESNQGSVITEIVLGPKCRTDRDTVLLLLHQLGFKDVEVTTSNASYR